MIKDVVKPRMASKNNEKYLVGEFLGKRTRGVRLNDILGIEIIYIVLSSCLKRQI